MTARVHGGEVSWPSMNKYPYAETSPVWIGSTGSIDPVVAKQSAFELLRVLEASEMRLKEGYGTAPIPNLLGHFDKARKKLESMANE